MVAVSINNPIIMTTRRSTIGARIGAVVQAELERRDWTQGQLAAKATVSQPVISDLIAGRTADPRAETLVKIGEAFGWSAGALLDLSVTRPDDARGTEAPSPIPDGPIAQAFRLLREEVRLAMEVAQRAQATAEEAKRQAAHRARKSA